MARLVLTMTMSLDGFFAGPSDELDWMTQAPDPEFSRDNTAQAFVRLGLVDEYVLTVHPVALGSGKRVFTGRTGLLAAAAASPGAMAGDHLPGC